MPSSSVLQGLLGRERQRGNSSCCTSTEHMEGLKGLLPSARRTSRGCSPTARISESVCSLVCLRMGCNPWCPLEPEVIRQTGIKYSGPNPWEKHGKAFIGTRVRRPNSPEQPGSSKGCNRGLFLLPVTLCRPTFYFLFFFYQQNSAPGGENEQAANERAAAAVCQACGTPLGAQLDAVGGWTPFIFTLELFSSHPVCSVLFISEAVHPLSDGHRCRMRAPTFPVKADFRIKTDGGGGGEGGGRLGSVSVSMDGIAVLDAWHCPHFTNKQRGNV